MYMVHLIRDYLDLIRKFTRTEAEKRGSLEDQQTHLRTGLDKLLETQSQVYYTTYSELYYAILILLCIIHLRTYIYPT